MSQPSNMMTGQALYAVTHHYEVLYQYQTAAEDQYREPWHDGTLQHHLMNGKVLVIDAAEEVIAEDFKFVQASHKVWSSGKFMSLGENVSVEVQSFVRASRTDVAPLVQTGKRGADRDKNGGEHSVQAGFDPPRPSKYGRFEFPDKDADRRTGQSAGPIRKPASMGRFVGLSDEEKQMLEVKSPNNCFTSSPTSQPDQAQNEGIRTGPSMSNSRRL